MPDIPGSVPNPNAQLFYWFGEMNLNNNASSWMYIAVTIFPEYNIDTVLK